MVKVDYVMCAFYEMKMVVVDLADCLSWVSGYFGLFLIIHHYEQDQTYGCRGPCRGPPLVESLLGVGLATIPITPPYRTLDNRWRTLPYHGLEKV